MFLAEVQSELARGEWFDAEAGKVTLAEYATAWLAERPNLSETTRERYDSAFRLQIRPGLGGKAVGEIREPMVRRWRNQLLDSGVGPASVAKAYRLLRAIMNTAVDDGLIRRNPCRIKGASKDGSPERPVLALSEVFAVAAAVPRRYRALVLLATFTSLRFGELAALRRSDVDVVTGTVFVTRGQVELSDGRLVVRAPKSEAGRRTVSVPAAILPDLEWHLEHFAEAGEDGRVFVGPKGGLLRRQNFRRIWLRAVTAAGVKSVHFHDLRHTGNTLAAASGASLRELMVRMGHASTRAAVIYQHATSERDRHIAEALSTQITAARARSGAES